jgi:hypothetical protein
MAAQHKNCIWRELSKMTSGGSFKFVKHCEWKDAHNGISPRTLY